MMMVIFFLVSKWKPILNFETINNNNDRKSKKKSTSFKIDHYYLYKGINTCQTQQTNKQTNKQIIIDHYSIDHRHHHHH